MFASHWLALPPAQERAALAKLDLEAGALELVYRFEALEDELAAAAGRRSRTHERSTSTLEQARNHPSCMCTRAGRGCSEGWRPGVCSART